MIESMGRRLDRLKREKTQTDDKLPDLPYHTMKMNLYSRAEVGGGVRSENTEQNLRQFLRK